MNYQFDFLKHINWSLPPFLRKTKVVAFLLVLVSPIVTLYESFISFLNEAIYFANLTSQTALFEKYLNDQLDPIERRISIIHSLQGGLFIGSSQFSEDGVFFGLKSEIEDGEFIELKGEVTETLSVDFRVIVPPGINQQELIGFILNYKLAGKSFEIEVS